MSIEKLDIKGKKPSEWQGSLNMGKRITKPKHSQVHYKGMSNAIDPLPMPRIK